MLELQRDASRGNVIDVQSESASSNANKYRERHIVFYVPSPETYFD